MTTILEKHLNHGNLPIVPGVSNNGNENFTFSLTKDTKIHSLGMCLGGPELQPSECGFLYLWRDANHFTFMLPITKGSNMSDYIVFPEGCELLIPAGANYCFRWAMSNLSTPRQIFADIAYSLHDPVI